MGIDLNSLVPAGAGGGVVAMVVALYKIIGPRIKLDQVGTHASEAAIQTWKDIAAEARAALAEERITAEARASLAEERIARAEARANTAADTVNKLRDDISKLMDDLRNTRDELKEAQARITELETAK